MAQVGRDEKGKFIAKNTWQMLKEVYSGGRPRVYDDADQMLLVAMEYFEWADEVHKGKYAEADLRLFLGFHGRTTWHDYKHNPKFTNAIYIIESILEGDTEKKLMWAGSTQGAIFKLKNKHGWKDEITQNQNVATVIQPQVVSVVTPLASNENDVK